MFRADEDAVVIVSIHRIMGHEGISCAIADENACMIVIDEVVVDLVISPARDENGGGCSLTAPSLYVPPSVVEKDVIADDPVAGFLALLEEVDGVAAVLVEDVAFDETVVATRVYPIPSHMVNPVADDLVFTAAADALSAVSDLIAKQAIVMILFARDHYSPPFRFAGIENQAADLDVGGAPEEHHEIPAGRLENDFPFLSRVCRVARHGVHRGAALEGKPATAVDHRLSIGALPDEECIA